MFERKYHIRYSDLDINKKLSIPTIVDYFQDVATRHSAHYGYGLDELNNLNVAFMLYSWRVKILDRPRYTDEITVRTWSSEIKSVFGQRNYEIDANGKTVVSASSIWVLIDLANGRPKKIEEPISSGYPIEPGEPFDTPPSKLFPLKDFNSSMKFIVNKRDMDTNNHLNNMRSFQMLTELLPEHHEIEQFEVQYKKSAGYGEELFAAINQVDKNTYLCELRNAKNESCVLSKFIVK